MASLAYWCHFVSKQKSTLTAYGIANIFPHKKNNVQLALMYIALKT